MTNTQKPWKYPLARWTYDDTEWEAVSAVFACKQTTCGPRVEAFEHAFASYVGAKHAIMVNSGSSADLLLALGLGPAQPGDEVLVPAVTWPTQLSSLLIAGYTPVLVDVDPATLQMDLDDLERKISGRTAAVFPTHVLGNVGNMSELEEVKGQAIDVVEDCCEALGARWEDQHVGTFGNAGAFSFFFSHTINTMEGGMVVTDDADDARRYRLWRAHGMEPQPNNRFHFPSWGFNLRPTEIQGALGLAQLGRLDEFLWARQLNYDRLAKVTFQRWPDLLRGVDVPPGCTPAWHGFPLLVKDGAGYTRDELCKWLNEYGVETRPIITGNIAWQPAVINDSRVIAGIHLPGAETVHMHGFYIGIASVDDEEGTTFVGNALRAFVEDH